MRHRHGYWRCTAILHVSYAGFLLGIFFRGGKIYCYANFYCYSIVFGPNFKEGRKFSGGETASEGGRPPVPPVEESQLCTGN